MVTWIFKTTHVLPHSAEAILAKADNQNQLFQLSCLSRHNRPQTRDLPLGRKQRQREMLPFPVQKEELLTQWEPKAGSLTLHLT